MNLGWQRTVVLNQRAAPDPAAALSRTWLQGFRLLRLIAPAFRGRI